MVHKTIKKVMAFVFFLFLIGPIVSNNVYGINQKQWYVDDDAEYPGEGTFDSPFRYIWQAIQNSSNGDEIYVFDGFYQEGLYINKSVNLKRYYYRDDNLMPIINISINDNITICVPNVLISGFKIIGHSKTTIPLMTIMYSDDTKIEGNYFNTFNGVKGKQLIEIISSRNITILNNEINNYTIGIGLTPHSHSFVYNTTFINVIDNYCNAANIKDDFNFYGLIQEAIDNLEVRKIVYVHSGKYYENLKIINIPGIKIRSVKAKESTVLDGNGKRILEIFNSKNFEINGFSITNSSQDGVYIFLSNFGHIIQNKINNCWIGISILHSDNVLIDYNIISNNLYRGIAIEMSVYDAINNNKIKNNTVGLSLIGAQAYIKSNEFMFNNVNLLVCWSEFDKTDIELNNFYSHQGSNSFDIIDSNPPRKELNFHHNYYESLGPNINSWKIYFIIGWRNPIYKIGWLCWPSLIIDTHKSITPFDIPFEP